MKILFSKNEFKEIKEVYNKITESLYVLGEFTINDYENSKDLKSKLKSNSIVTYKFFTSSITVEINPNLIEELLREYGDLVTKLMPLMYSLVPTVKAIAGITNMSAKKFENIIETHSKEYNYESEYQE